MEQQTSDKSIVALEPTGVEYESQKDERLAADETAAETSNAVHALERWNSPTINAWRFMMCLLGFFVMGANDAALGALIPSVQSTSRLSWITANGHKLEEYYGISYTVVSCMFLAPFVGYTVAAVLNNPIHMRFGRRGIAIIAPICRIIAYVVLALHPPYAVLPVFLVFAGLGNGLEDGAWNAWVGNMVNANELLGFLHGMYGLGATVSPLVATAMVTSNLPWYTFYYVLLGLTGIEFVLAVIVFKDATGALHRAAHPVEANGHSRIREALHNRITWLCAIFLLAYVGVEVSLGGWLVTFMLNIRNAQRFAAGLTVTGFWLGLTIGRVILGFVTGRIGEKLAIAAYLGICIVLEILFWLIPSFISSAIFAGFLGFFLGPLFPAAIVVAAKLLPRSLHVTAIGLAAAFGGGGAAILPFAVGAIASARGVQVLQPIILAFLAFLLVLWCTLPGGFRKQGLETYAHRDEAARARDDEEVDGLRNRVLRLRQRAAKV